MKDFNDKVVLITGGSSGIGLALANELVGKGAILWLLARNIEKLEAAQAQLQQKTVKPSQRIGIIQADVANFEQLEKSLHTLIGQVGAPDMLINSAGITHPGLFDEMDLSFHRDNMEINYFGSLYTTRLLIPGMKKRQSGCIVNISSLVGFHGLYGYSAYAPSKFAIRGLSDALRYEFKPFGIQISVAYPSDTETPQLEYENKHKPPILKALVDSSTTPVPADVVAKNILKGVMRNRYIILPTTDALLLYIVYSLLPGYGMYRFVDLLMNNARRKAAKNLTGE